MISVTTPPLTKKGRRHRTVVWVILYLSLALGVFLAQVITSNLGLEEKETTLGATFSTAYARQLDLDWKQAFTASLDDLGIRNWRLPAYWNDLEPEPHTYDFSDLDWQVEEVTKRNGHVILAIGRKLPRWPECHVPEWTRYLPEEIVRQRLLTAMETTVRRYADSPTVVAWQVENEPLFDFGECPELDLDFLRREIALVRSLDDRPVMITESGELSTWVKAAGLADILGISTYRIVWNEYVGHFYWPITPKAYRHRAGAVRQIVSKIIVSELQAEPWTVGPIEDIPLDRQTEVMNPKRLASNVSFVRRMAFDEAYLWGVEWWYWLKQKGQPEMWAAARKVFQESTK